MAMTHVYQRQIDLESSSNDSLSIIFSKISENSLVLDVGAGVGALGRALKEDKQCRVHGISYNPDEVEILKQHYDVALQVDLEQDDLPSEIKSVQYDFVVCADVFEHLKNAHDVFRRLTGLLKPEGRLILSVPNISHVSIVISLLNGRFIRTYEGLLDSTHVNFFERNSLTQFCKDAGVSVVDQDAVYRDVARTEFSNIHSTGLPSSVLQYVEQLPDAGVYQFIWTVERSFEADAEVPVSISYPSRPEFDVRARFELKLYLDFGRGFNEADVAVGYGLYTDGLQDVQFVLPHNRGALSAWRIDWPQWPCVLEFVQIDCRDNQGRELLCWKGSWSENVKFDQCNMLPDLGENGFPILAMSGKNAAIEMRLTSDLPVQVMNLRMGSPFRLPLDLEERLLKRANIQRVEFDKVNVYLNQVQTKLAFLDEHVLYMVRQTGTELGQVQEKLAVLDENVRYISKHTGTELGQVQEKLAVLDENVRYISKHTVTNLDQKYYWNALNERLDRVENILVILKDENISFPKFLKLAYRRIKGWLRGR